MKITPVEISKQEFKKAMRGYDPVEVDTYLEMLANEFEKLINANKNYEKRLIELESELKSFKEHESTLKQTLVNVQESTTKSRENSKKEADLIKREAEVGAVEMIEKARREVQTLREEKVMLDTQKKSLISRLRHVLTSQMELLDVLEIDEKDISKLRDRTKKVFSAPKKSNVEIEITKGERSNETVTAKPEIVSNPNPKSEPKPEPKPEPDAPKNEENEGKVDSDIFKDVFGNDLDIEKYTK